MDVPWYLRLIAEGKQEEANAVIREKVPLPGIWSGLHYPAKRRAGGRM